MAWIEEIEYEDAEGRLKSIYEKVKGPDNNVDNVLKIHSLRPHSLVGHMALYKNVLHNSNNTVPKWFLETLGVYTSYLNKCKYCVEHHFNGLKRLLNNDERANQIIGAVENDDLETCLEEKYVKATLYAKKLTLSVVNAEKKDIEELKKVGFSDGEILEINQVVSYFNYVNRTVVGLGVNTNGDVLGLSPNDSKDENNWSHS